MFCSGCEKEIAENSKFCPECGKELSEKSKPQPKKTDDDLSNYKAKYPDDFITPKIRLFNNFITENKSLRLKDWLVILTIIIVLAGGMVWMLYFSDYESPKPNDLPSGYHPSTLP
ncbi:MAG: hypothetical protein CL715_03730 [Chloroflexi bacterium]|nr:hypothetical protein [Chloroflexota bacterium]